MKSQHSQIPEAGADKDKPTDKSIGLTHCQDKNRNEGSSHPVHKCPDF